MRRTPRVEGARQEPTRVLSSMPVSAWKNSDSTSQARGSRDRTQGWGIQGGTQKTVARACGKMGKCIRLVRPRCIIKYSVSQVRQEEIKPYNKWMSPLATWDRLRSSGTRNKWGSSRMWNKSRSSRT